MNKSALVSEVARRSGVEPASVAKVLDALLDAIREVVAKGERVALAGFGTFERVRRNARTGRNPHTGEAVQIPARAVPAFRAGRGFKEAVAKPPRKRSAAKRVSRR